MRKLPGRIVVPLLIKSFGHGAGGWPGFPAKVGAGSEQFERNVGAKRSHPPPGRSQAEDFSLTQVGTSATGRGVSR